MYCPSCGKEIRDGSAYCSSCGKATNGGGAVAVKQVPPPVTEWEFQDYKIDIPQGQGGWVSAEAYPEPAARLYYWQNIQATVLPELQALFDQGWQPITEVGASCVQLRHYKSLEGANWLGIIIGIIVSWGLLIFALPFMGSYKFQMIGFYVQLRRPKIMGDVVV